MDKTMLDTFSNLQQWTRSLAKVVEDVIPQMKDALEGKVKLPEGCPSKESMAELELRQIEKKLREVNAAVTDIRNTLFK